jgi:hypothetical protein
VIVSDHGEFLGEHDLLDHGHYLWEPNNLVPMMVFSTERSFELPEPVSALRAYDLARGDFDAPTRPITAFAYPGQRWYRASGGRVGGSSSVALWSGDAKLVWRDGKASLYDLSADPDEQHPRDASDHPLLPELLENVRRYLAPSKNAPSSPEMIEMLRSIGYVE